MNDARLLADLAELLHALALADRAILLEGGQGLALDDRLIDALDALDLHVASQQLLEAARACGHRL